MFFVLENKYECTMDQELVELHSPDGSIFFCVKWRHGRHLERMTSCQKSESVSRCIFTWKTFLLNFVRIRF